MASPPDEHSMAYQGSIGNPFPESSENDFRDEGANCLLVHFLADATAGCSAVLIKADDLVFAREELADAQGAVGG